MNLLIDALPTSVNVSGVEHEINCTAESMIRLSVFIEENPVPIGDTESGAVIAMTQLSLFYKEVPADYQEAMVKLIEFYTHSADCYGRAQKKTGADETRCYSFAHDSGLIYSAFSQQYPSKSIADLHWFEFKVMLENLTDECLFVKVTQWRSIKIDGKMSRPEKKFYRRMKRLYALPDNRPRELKDTDFASGLAYL